MASRSKRLRPDTIYPHQRVFVAPAVVDIYNPHAAIEIELTADEKRDLRDARIAPIARSSLWKPRDPSWRSNLSAKVLRVNKSDDAPVSYISGGIKFEDPRRVFLALYMPREEAARRETELRRAGVWEKLTGTEGGR